MGAGGLCPKLLIETHELIAYPLLLLLQKSLRKSSFPQDWTEANITPIFKQGNRNRVEITGR